MAENFGQQANPIVVQNENDGKRDPYIGNRTNEEEAFIGAQVEEKKS